MLEWVRLFSYPAVFLLLAATGVGAPVSEDLVMLAGGALAAAGGAKLPLMMATAAAGVLSADGLLFRIGRAIGPRALASRRLSRLLTPRRVEWVRRHLARHGALTVFAARFLPGMRVPTFLLAGMGGLPARTFLLADGLGVLLYAPLMTYVGFRFGLAVFARVRAAGSYAVLGAVALVLAVIAVAMARRRLRASRLRRREAEAGTR